MGGIECSSVKRELFLQALIERKLENKDTPLDTKIHNEYLNILGLASNHKDNHIV